MHSAYSPQVLLQLQGQFTDLLLFGQLLVLLAQDLIHHLLHQAAASYPRLVGFDHDLLPGLQRLLSSDLDEVSPAVMLDNLGLDDLLAALGWARLCW